MPRTNPTCGAADMSSLFLSDMVFSFGVDKKIIVDSVCNFMGGNASNELYLNKKFGGFFSWKW
ncbi:MAG: hypothetical protein Fur002_25550 [Anaerolineales bacterium]